MCHQEPQENLNKDKWPEPGEQKAQAPVCAGDRPATTQLYRRGPEVPGGQHVEYEPGTCPWQPGLL